MNSEQFKYRLLERLFYLAVLAMTATTAATALGARGGWWLPQGEEMNRLQWCNLLYFICLVGYAGLRQLRKRLYPKETYRKRFGQYFVAFWVLVSIAGLFDANFFHHQYFPLVKELIVITGNAAGVFLGGELAKRLSPIKLGETEAKE